MNAVYKFMPDVVESFRELLAEDASPNTDHAFSLARPSSAPATLLAHQHELFLFLLLF
jgi:hypothetical protein